MRRFSSCLLRSPKGMNSSSRRWRRSPSDRFLFSETPSTKKCSNQIVESMTSSFSRTTFLSSINQQYVPFSTIRKKPDNTNQLEVEIISKEFIKPMNPTPQHSRMYEVSFLDQLLPNVYIPFVYFYPNNHKSDPDQLMSHDDLILKRRQLLKQSLSETLTIFYPLAGRIKGSRHIDCNDDGVYYVEAKVDNHFSDFLKQPENKSMHRLLPFGPNSVQLICNYLAMVQVTVFGCGGIAIGLYASHRIIDGNSLATFIKAWAATARGFPKQICPNFITSSVFPSNPSLRPENLKILPFFPESKTVTKRFVFGASSLATLKKKVESSRVKGVMGLIWKCTMTASQAQSTARNCKPKRSSLTMTVNLRDRSSPPMPPHSIGNIFWSNPPILSSGDEDLGLDSIVQRIQDSTHISGDFIEGLKGVGFSVNVEKPLSELKMFYSDENVKHMFITSICNTGTYDADFGWGNPIWVSFGLSDTKRPIFENFVILMDTRFGDGIEAWVTLPEEDMAFLEQDPELISLATVNPSPLERVE